MKRAFTRIATLLLVCVIGYDILLRIVPDQDPYIFGTGLTVAYPTRPETKTPQSIKLQCLQDAGIKVRQTVANIDEIGFDKGAREYGCGGTCRRLLLEHGFQRIETAASDLGFHGFIGLNASREEEEAWRQRLLFIKPGAYDYLASTTDDDRCVPYLAYYSPASEEDKQGSGSPCIASIYSDHRTKRTLASARYRIRQRYEVLDTVTRRLNALDVFKLVFSNRSAVNKRPFRSFIEEIYDAETGDVLASKTAFPGCALTDAETGQRLTRTFSDQEIASVLIPSQ